MHTYANTCVSMHCNSSPPTHTLRYALRRSSVCPLVFARRHASYFNVGKISAEHVADYAARKDMVEKWLRPILGYSEDV